MVHTGFEKYNSSSREKELLRQQFSLVLGKTGLCNLQILVVVFSANSSAQSMNKLPKERRGRQSFSCRLGTLKTDMLFSPDFQMDTDEEDDDLPTFKI